MVDRHLGFAVDAGDPGRQECGADEPAVPESAALGQRLVREDATAVVVATETACERQVPEQQALPEAVAGRSSRVDGGFAVGDRFRSLVRFEVGNYERRQGEGERRLTGSA